MRTILIIPLVKLLAGTVHSLMEGLIRFLRCANLGVAYLAAKALSAHDTLKKLLPLSLRRIAKRVP